MSFGSNLQFMRKMHDSMTQEELAEKMSVSRQTVSKWEMDAAFPEMEKAIALAGLFNCSLDELMRGDLNSMESAYTNIRVETVKAFRYVRYAVLSPDPETDALAHMEKWAKENGIAEPKLIGWDFPFLSQEQINVFHMHGYTAACVLPEETKWADCKDAISQPDAKYALITIREPFINPFLLIPNAYKTLGKYIDINGLKHSQPKELINCFERSYVEDGIVYMDVAIAVD